MASPSAKNIPDFGENGGLSPSARTRRSTATCPTYTMKVEKNRRRISPSPREMMGEVPFRCPSFVSTIKANAARSMKGISFQTVPRVAKSGRITEDAPRMRRILHVLLPTTLPMLRSGLPFMLARRLTTSSGADVPNATIVSPTTRSETPKARASIEALLTSQSAPVMSQGEAENEYCEVQ